MHWSLRLILDLPKSILLFRKNHIKMTKLHKIEKKHGSIASFKAMILDPELSQAEMEIYVDLLPEIMENTEIYSTEEMEWFLTKGEEYGILKRVEESPPIDDSWKRWEEE
jgi:hypothetical protein